MSSIERYIFVWVLMKRISMKLLHNNNMWCRTIGAPWAVRSSQWHALIYIFSSLLLLLLLLLYKDDNVDEYEMCQSSEWIETYSSCIHWLVNILFFFLHCKTIFENYVCISSHSGIYASVNAVGIWNMPVIRLRWYIHIYTWAQNFGWTCPAVRFIHKMRVKSVDAAAWNQLLSHVLASSIATMNV